MVILTPPPPIFLGKFLIFYPENGFLGKNAKNIKTENGVKTALTPLLKKL